MDPLWKTALCIGLLPCSDKYLGIKRTLIEALYAFSDGPRVGALRPNLRDWNDRLAGLQGTRANVHHRRMSLRLRMRPYKTSLAEMMNVDVTASRLERARDCLTSHQREVSSVDDHVHREGTAGPHLAGCAMAHRDHQRLSRHLILNRSTSTPAL
jgi:hypothetical protein